MTVTSRPRCPNGFPVLVSHDGPGLDHHEFAGYLDTLPADGRYRPVLVDQRAQGLSDRSAPKPTWTVPGMAADVSALAAVLGEKCYAVLGHTFGAFVALQHTISAYVSERYALKVDFDVSQRG